MSGIGALWSTSLLLFVFIVIFAIMLGAFKRMRGCFLFVAIAMMVVGYLFVFGRHANDSAGTAAAPKLTVTANASAEGGWVVSLPDTGGAAEYTVLIDGVELGSTTQPGDLHVFPQVPANDAYLSGPVHHLRVGVTPDGRKTRWVTADFCAPVVMLAARGTDQNPPKDTFAHGLGSRGWATWLDLAGQTGVKPTAAGRSPTAIDAAGVEFPAHYLNYVPSRNAGSRSLVAMMKAVHKNCPDTKTVLLGYSQGADIVNSVRMAEVSGADQVIGLIAYADPHFDRRWVQAGIALPDGAVFKHDGSLNARGQQFTKAELVDNQQWCLPKDPVCQGPANQLASLKLHGPEYDTYEEWAAYNLAPTVSAALSRYGYPTPARTVPTKTPSTEGR